MYKNKKILVSDYDQTFYLSDEDIEINKNKVKVFRELGNVFVIATGRSYFDFNSIKDIYNVEYDYVILNHGATILDSKDNEIYNCCIENSIIQDLKNDLQLEIAIQTFCCSEFENKLTFDCVNLTKISVTYNDRETAKKMVDILNKKYSGYINVYLVLEDTLEIISNKTNKALAIELLVRKLQLTKDNVYTIGDGYSDVEMVKKFNGYCMKDSVKELKEIALKEVESVWILLNELMEDKRNEQL